MKKIELTAEDIVNLIFEKKIKIGENELLAKNSCLAILAELDRRLNDGKIFNRKNTMVLGSAWHEKNGHRRRANVEVL